MKILIVVSSLQIGGEQRVLSILTNQFVNYGIDVTIYSLTNKTDKQFRFNPKVHIIYENACNTRFKNFKRIRKIRKLLCETKYDLLLGFAVIPSVLCAFAGVRKCPVIVTERNDPSIYSLKMKFMRYFAYHLCTEGIFQTIDAANYFPYIKRKTIIPNPLNREILPEVYEGKKTKRIVNISRLVPEKNQAMLVVAFAALHEKYPEYSLAFYGDGPEKDNLLKLGQELGISDKLSIFPATKEILNIIKKDAIFVLTSNYEGFPNSLAEALALGISCISTECRIGGPHDMLNSYTNGILIPVGDTNALVEALDSLLGNVELQKSFSKESICIRDKLADDKIADLWITEFKKCCKMT